MLGSDSKSNTDSDSKSKIVIEFRLDKMRDILSIFISILSVMSLIIWSDLIKIPFIDNSLAGTITVALDVVIFSLRIMLFKDNV